jgi:hypothetical protein
MKERHENELEPQLRDELRRNAVLDPPGWLDRRILRRINQQPVLKPFLAGGLALAALIAMVTWLAVLYAESETSLPPVPAAVLTSLIYLAFCSVATLPLMMFPGRFGLGMHAVKETT